MGIVVTGLDSFLELKCVAVASGRMESVVVSKSYKVEKKGHGIMNDFDFNGGAAVRPDILYAGDDEGLFQDDVLNAGAMGGPTDNFLDMNDSSSRPPSSYAQTPNMRLTTPGG